MTRVEVAILAVIALLIGGGVFLWVAPSEEEEAAPVFAAAMAEYLALDKATEGQGQSTGTEPHFRGKGVAVDLVARTLDPLHFELPDALRAETPEEVGTVIFVECETNKVGDYGFFADAYGHSCDIRVIDRKTREVVHDGGASASPPRRVYFPFWDRIAERPHAWVLDDIEKLPRVP